MIVAIIPARKGSKSLRGKNTKPLLGKPLIAWTIEAALNSKKVELIAISTDDEKIMSMKKMYRNIIFIKRPQRLSLDRTSTHDVVLHAVEHLEKRLQKGIDLVLTLQPTSPLRTNFHIDAAINLFHSGKKPDSLVSCIKVPHNYERNSQMRFENKLYLKSIKNTAPILRRQEKTEYYARNGAAIYLTKRSSLNKYIWGGRCLGFEMNTFESVDIDSIEDFALAEMLLKFKFSGRYENYFSN